MCAAVAARHLSLFRKVTLVLLAALIPISLVALPILFWWIRRSARREGPVINGPAIEFPLTRSMRALIGLVLALLVAFTLLVLAASLRAGGSTLVALIPVSVLVAIVLAIPQSVVLDESGIHQKRLLFSNRKTAWTEVSTVSRDDRTGRTLVWSTDGEVAAVFSPVLVGPAQFEREIRTRAKNVVFEIEED